MATEDASFDIRTDPGGDPGDTLIFGTANPGLAGLTALDYLITNGLTDQLGHVATRKLPDITPFRDGEPRYPMRLYTARDSDVSILLSEVFVPVWAGEPLADAVTRWAVDHGIDEVAVVHGVPFPHGPDEHVVFHVSTPEFRERRLAGHEIRGLGGGFFDGVVGELVTRSLDGDAPATGVLVTPAHPPGPDFESALRFLQTLADLYGLEIDETELRSRSEEIKRYFQELADRMEAMEQAEHLAGRDYPEDRMFM